MGKVYVGKGTAEKGMIRLDDGTGLPQGRVSVIVEKERPKPGHSIFDIEPPPGPGRSTEEILRDLRSLRDEWERPWYRDDWDGRGEERRGSTSTRAR